MTIMISLIAFPLFWWATTQMKHKVAMRYLRTQLVIACVGTIIMSLVSK